MDRTTLAELCALDYNWSVSDAHRYVNEFLDRFLVLKRLTRDYESTHCAPSPIINLVWRQAVLLTKAYAKECGLNFIHYSPMERAHSNDYRMRYEYTISMYKRTFKAKPPGDIWPVISYQDKVKPASEPFYIIIEDSDGKQIIIDQLYAKTSISFVHTRIQDIEGIPFEEQMLLFHGETLVKMHKLSAYELKEGSVLKLIRKQRRWSWIRR